MSDPPKRRRRPDHGPELAEAQFNRILGRFSRGPRFPISTPRRGRGRPSDKELLVVDQMIVDMAAALAEVYELSPARRARRHAMALLLGKPDADGPPQLPRGAGKLLREKPSPDRPPPRAAGTVPRFILAGRKLPKTVSGHEASVLRHLKGGKVRPRPEVVEDLVRILRAKDEDLMRLLVSIATATVAGNT